MAANFSVSPRRREWVEGASVIVDLVIANDGPEPIEVPNPTFVTSPQPRYRVVRPNGEAVEFIPDVRNGTSAVTLIRIAPGETWRGDLTPGSYVDLGDPGDYEISAELEWQGVEAKAEPKPFRITALNVEGVSSSISRAANGQTLLECVLLQRTPAGVRSLAVLIEEEDPSNAELREPDLQDRGALSADTVEVIGAFANYSTGRDATRWVVARTPDQLLVGTNLDASHAALTARGNVRLLRPLAVKDRTLYLLAVLVDGIAAELGLARVQRRDALPATAAFRTVAIFRGAPVAAAAALAPEPLGALFIVATVQKAEEGARVQLLQVRPDAGMPQVQQTVFDGIEPLGGIAVHWSSDGRIRASFLGRLSREDELAELQVAEVECDVNLSTASLTKRRIPFRAGAEVERVTISYFERRDAEVTRIALVQHGGQAWAAIDGRPAQSVPIPATVSPALIPGRYFWYAVWPVGGKLAIQSL